MLRNPLLVPDLRELIQAGETDGAPRVPGGPPPGPHLRDHRGLRATRKGTRDPRPPARPAPRVGDELRRARAAGPRRRGDADDRGRRAAAPDVARRPGPPGQSRLDEDRADEILRHLAQAEREDIRRLASYEPGTAGAVMTTDYATLTPGITVREALDRLRREAPDRETIDYSFVVDPDHKLLRASSRSSG